MTAEHQELRLQSRTESGPDGYRFRTADGVNSPDAFRDAELLLLDVLWERSPERLLVVQANYGVVGTVMAAVTREVVLTETSARAVRLSRENLSRNDVDAAVRLVPSPADARPESGAAYDTACYAPAGYTPIPVGKQRLAAALSALEPGGRLYVAGQTETGLARYEDCLDSHSNAVETVRTRGDLRVVAATRPEQFEPPEYVTPGQIGATIGGTDLSLVTLPGLFSPDSLDDGTRLLLGTAAVGESDRILDIACGYGPAGAYAARQGADVVLSDDNVRATTCARRSLSASGVDGTVVTADCARGVRGDRFDRVLCNPPTHAGSGLLSELFAGVADVLAPGGDLFAVHHRTLDLDATLRAVGPVVDRTHGDQHTVVRVRAEPSNR